MENDRQPSLREKLERLREERDRLAEVVFEYRLVRDSRFSRLADLTRAIKRAFGRLDEPPALSVLDFPPPTAAADKVP